MSTTSLSSTDGQDEHYVVGVDYGTLSGRAVVVRVRDGAELATAVHDYPHAVMDRELTVGRAAGTRLPADWALQVPQDYVEVLQIAVPRALAEAGVDVAQVIGIGTDFTACTLLPVDERGTPLGELERWAGSPHAYVKLWRHHAAQAQAAVKPSPQSGQVLLPPAGLTTRRRPRASVHRA